MARRAAMGAVIALLPLLSCSAVSTEILPPPDGAPSPGADGGRAPCSAPGPPIHLGDDSPRGCAGAIAARAARHALCSCLPVVLTGSLVTDSVDSRRPGPPERRGAAVATDGDFESSGLVTLGGPLIAAGSGVQLVAPALVGQSLRSGGPLATSSSLSLTGDGWVGGDVVGTVRIFGALHLPTGAVVGPRVTASRVIREPVLIAKPCNCDAPPPVDAGALVAARALRNDNQRLGFDPAALADPAVNLTLDLACGEYFVPSLRTGRTEIELRVHGRVAVFVAGTAALGRGLRVTLDPTAELDLVVAGGLTLGGGTVGSSLAPARVRLWVGGTTIRLADDTRLAAVVHAPSAALSAAERVEVSGALVVRSLSAPEQVTLHYDRAILAGGGVCGLPPEPEVP